MTNNQDLYVAGKTSKLLLFFFKFSILVGAKQSQMDPCDCVTNIKHLKNAL